MFLQKIILYTDYRLGIVVHSVFEEKSKARKQAKKQYDKILRKPSLLAEKNRNILGEKVFTGLTRGCLTNGKIRNLMKLGFFEAARLWKNNWNQNWTEKHTNLRIVNRGELIFLFEFLWSNGGRLWFSLGIVIHMS